MTIWLAVAVYLSYFGPEPVVVRQDVFLTKERCLNYVELLAEKTPSGPAGYCFEMEAKMVEAKVKR